MDGHYASCTVHGSDSQLLEHNIMFAINMPEQASLAARGMAILYYLLLLTPVGRRIANNTGSGAGLCSSTTACCSKVHHDGTGTMPQEIYAIVQAFAAAVQGLLQRQASALQGLPEAIAERRRGDAVALVHRASPMCAPSLTPSLHLSHSELSTGAALPRLTLLEIVVHTEKLRVRDVPCYWAALLDEDCQADPAGLHQMVLQSWLSVLMAMSEY